MRRALLLAATVVAGCAGSAATPTPQVIYVTASPGPASATPPPAASPTSTPTPTFPPIDIETATPTPSPTPGPSIALGEAPETFGLRVCEAWRQLRSVSLADLDTEDERIAAFVARGLAELDLNNVGVWAPGDDLVAALKADENAIEDALNSGAPDSIEAQGARLSTLLAASDAHEALTFATGFDCDPGSPAFSPAPTDAPLVINGEGTKNTAPFDLAGGDYRVDWQVAGSCFYSTDLVPIGEEFGESVGGAEIIEEGAPREDATYLYGVMVGRYYLDVSASGCTWSYTFTEQ